MNKCLIYSILILNASFLFWGCSSKERLKKDLAEEEEISFQSIEIPICYDYSWQTISFDICINGRDSLFAIFDTGAYGVSIPKPLEDKYLKHQDSLSITAGQYSKVFTENVRFVPWNIGGRRPDDDSYFSNILIGWGFFEGEIIELSFDKQYIKVLNSTAHLSDYEGIPFKRDKDDIYIPVTISIQGEKVRSLSLIDTGFNSTFLSYKGIFPKLDYTKFEKAYGILSGYRKFTGYFLQADTIQIGNNYICNKNIGITDNNEVVINGQPTESLLGCSFLENYTVVFDFKNYVLYLKPINN